MPGNSGQSGQIVIHIDGDMLRGVLQAFSPASSFGDKLDQLLARTQQIMASQQDFQQKIDQINQNTSASAQAAQAIATNLQSLRTQLDQVLTNAGIPPDQEQQILDQISAAADTSTALRTFLEQTASNSTGTEPTPVPVPQPAPNATTRR